MSLPHSLWEESGGATLKTAAQEAIVSQSNRHFLFAVKSEDWAKTQHQFLTERDKNKMAEEKLKKATPEYFQHLIDCRER